MHRSTKRRFLVIIIIILLCWAALKWYHISRQHAEINSHPQYFMKVAGNIAPKWGALVALQWRVHYQTHNPQCPTHKLTLSYNTTLKKNGDFSRKIPLDGLKPGFCNWQPGKMQFYSKAFGAETIAEFTHEKLINPAVIYHAGKAELQCSTRNHKLYCKQTVRKDFVGNLKLHLGQYSYQLFVR